MARTKFASRPERRKKPAFASADASARKSFRRGEITLSEEEISDVSLAPFYVFDRENGVKPRLGGRPARWARGCGGCGGCSCGAGCGSCRH